jgi:hypothetical protein
MKSNYIQEAYDSVKLFNSLAGNLTGVTSEGIDSQLTLCFEELTEAIDGHEAGNKTELLDGAVDMFVVGAGLLQKLEAAGYDVERALKRVTENNLTKYPKTMSEFEVREAKALGYSVNFNADHGCYVLKDSAGKIRKPMSYKGVKLNDLVGSVV